jgi:hypothetical protein
MARFSMEVDLKQLEKELNKTIDEMHEGIERGLKVCASEIKQMEQKQVENTTGGGSYVPTGQLKRSVTIMPIEWSPYGASITIVPTASYAQYVEQGTGIFNPQGRQGGWVYPIGDGTYRFTMGMPPHHFVSDTHDFYKDKAYTIVKNEVLKCIR